QLLQRKIAWAWLMRGSVDRAEAVLEADSSIEVLAVKGWIALFHGDLRGATEYFREAGPMAGTRAEATLRTETMALIQLVRPDTVPALGEALLALHRGDSVAAVSRLESVALALPPDGGRAEVLSLAGTVAFELGDYGVSERLLLDALAAMPNSAFAPLSAYALAQTYVVTGRRDAAIERLESVILDYPASAVVPRARRLLDQVRGMVPRS
ncbi:MAG: tol-pal system YbgF family protein, partial [Gemmatimonadales bacterium]